MNHITQEKVRRLFDYNENGSLIRRIKTGRKTKVGDEAGTEDGHGYRTVSIDYTPFRLHRLIFLWHHGFMPKHIDHIDNDSSNNKIENLRECTRSQNMCNAKLRKDNKSGVKGVTRRKDTGKWAAELRLNGEKICLGCFDVLTDAKAVIEEARQKYHGEFANDGFNTAIDNLK